MPNGSKALFNSKLMLTMGIRLNAATGYQPIARFFATGALVVGLVSAVF